MSILAMLVRLSIEDHLERPKKINIEDHERGEIMKLSMYPDHQRAVRVRSNRPLL